MFCNKCGADVKDGMEFCTSCGNPMGTQGAAPAAQGGKPASPVAGIIEKVKTNPNLQKILIGVVAVIVVIIGWNILFGSGAGSAEKAAEKYAKAYFSANKGGIQKMLPYTGKPAKYSAEGTAASVNYRKAASEDVKKMKFIEVEDTDSIPKDEWKHYEDWYDDSDVKLRGEIKDAENVTIKYEITDDDGDTDKEEMTLTVVKIGSRWYIWD